MLCVDCIAIYNFTTSSSSTTLSSSTTSSSCTTSSSSNQAQHRHQVPRVRQWLCNYVYNAFDLSKKLNVMKYNHSKVTRCSFHHHT